MEYISIGDKQYPLQSYVMGYRGERPTFEMVLAGALSDIVSSFSDPGSYSHITGDGISIDRSEYNTMASVAYVDATSFEVVMFMGDPIVSLQKKLEAEHMKVQNLEYQYEQANSEIASFSEALQEVIDA